jgi:hypothetical protein
MKVKLAKIFESKEILIKVIDMELPIKTAYKLSKIVKEVEKEFIVVDEMRNKLIKKLGIEKDGSISVPKEKEQEFYIEFTSLLNDETELNIEQINIDELENLNLTTKQIIAIDYLLKD